MLFYYDLLFIQEYEFLCFTSRETERLAQVVRNIVFYSGGTGIESRSGHRLSSLNLYRLSLQEISGIVPQIRP
jgi:hypothetical protein